MTQSPFPQYFISLCLLVLVLAGLMVFYALKVPVGDLEAADFQKNPTIAGMQRFLNKRIVTIPKASSSVNLSEQVELPDEVHIPGSSSARAKSSMGTPTSMDNMFQMMQAFMSSMGMQQTCAPQNKPSRPKGKSSESAIVVDVDQDAADDVVLPTASSPLKESISDDEPVRPLLKRRLSGSSVSSFKDAVSQSGSILPSRKRGRSKKSTYTIVRPEDEQTAQDDCAEQTSTRKKRKKVKKSKVDDTNE